MTTVKALLFDLGGVVIDISFVSAFQHWSALSPLSLENMQDRFQFDEIFQRFERGEIDEPKYFERLRKQLQLTGSDDQIKQGWNAIIRGKISETLEVVQQARQKLPCFAFSNTNETHITLLDRNHSNVLNAFDHVFLSSRIGMRKPEQAAFEFIAQSIDVPVHEILFFDDLAENINGAKRAGLQAVLVQNPNNVRDALSPFI